MGLGDASAQYLDTIDTPYTRRRRRPGPPRRAALLRDGRALLRRRHRRRHRPDGRPHPPGARRRCARLLDVALLRPPRQGRRGRARARTPTADEMVAIGEALRDSGHGTMEIISDHLDEPDELAWVEHIARLTGRPVTLLVDGDRRQRALAHWPTGWPPRASQHPAPGRGPAGVGADDARGHAQPAAAVPRPRRIKDLPIDEQRARAARPGVPGQAPGRRAQGVTASPTPTGSCRRGTACTCCPPTSATSRRTPTRSPASPRRGASTCARC